MDTFAKDWTYRSPMMTAKFRAGQTIKLDRAVQLKARRAGVLVPPQPETDDAHPNRAPKARKARSPRARKG